MTTAVDTAPAWQMRRGAVPLDRPIIAGILNLTTDSFSDGGRFVDPGAAVAHAHRLVAAGADMLDVGAESTRPGRPAPVPADEEWRRLEPVLTALASQLPRIPLSVDTVKADTARRALDAGAWIINDVSALRLDPTVADVCADQNAGLILMHSRGTVETMATYDDAHYGDIAREVRTELEASVARARQRGVPPERIVLDPGFGFSKTPEQTYRIFNDLPSVVALGFPVMVGPSRKRFLGAITGTDVADRDAATAAACVVARLLGAALFRVHAVAPAREALAVAHAVRSA